MSSDDGMIDVRCPVDTRRMFARMRSGVTVEGNLVEVACPECARSLRKMGESDVVRVLHRYDILGECIETEVHRKE